MFKLDETIGEKKIRIIQGGFGEKKNIKYVISKNRKKNHLIVLCPTDDEIEKEKIKEKIKKTTSQLNRLLKGGMSFEIHY